MHTTTPDILAVTRLLMRESSHYTALPGNFPGKDELIGALLQQYFADAFADLTR